MRVSTLSAAAIAGLLLCSTAIAGETSVTLEKGIDATLNVPDGAKGALRDFAAPALTAPSSTASTSGGSSFQL